MRAPDGFISLSAMLRPPVRSLPDEAIEPHVRLQDTPCGEQDAETHELVREIRLFRARVEERVEDAVQTIAGDIAAQILARELQLAPADLDAIVESAMRRFFSEEPIRIRVSEADEGRIDCGVPVVVDPALRGGDAAIDLRTGTIDVSLGARLDALLRNIP